MRQDRENRQPEREPSDAAGGAETGETPGWHAHRVMVFDGMPDTHKDTGEDYRQMTLRAVFQIPPGRCAKKHALAMVPSSFNDFNGRSHKVQRAKGDHRH